MIVIDEFARMNKVDARSARMELFKRYHVDSARVYSTFDYYSKDTTALHAIYKDAVRVLEDRLKLPGSARN